MPLILGRAASGLPVRRQWWDERRLSQVRPHCRSSAAPSGDLRSVGLGGVLTCTAMIVWPTDIDSFRVRQRLATISCCESDQGCHLAARTEASAGLHGSWFAVHVVHEPTGETVGMGRVLGDGGWYFHVIDMAVLPEHQRRGLGDVILTALLDRIREHAPKGAFVSLLADPPGVALYTCHGFVATSPISDGMALYLE